MLQRYRDWIILVCDKDSITLNIRIGYSASHIVDNNSIISYLY